MTQSTATPATPGPLIRPAELKDVQEISVFGAETFTVTFGHSMPAADLEAHLQSAYSPAGLAACLSNPSTELFVAYYPGSKTQGTQDTVVGFIQLTQGTTEPCIETAEAPIEIQRLYVGLGYQARGIGKALVNYVEELARKRGFKTLWLGVWEEHLKGQAVYGHLGFKKVGAHDFVIGSCVQSDWIMTKSL